jgi:predicted TIM-barrel fold metal-dependent hydrolase
VAEIESRDLIFETWIFHPQLGELADLARAFPRLRIVLDHIGTPLGVGSYANRREEVLADWRRGIDELAACPNVHIKLSGLAMHHTGFGLEDRAVPASSEELAGLWQPYIASCIEAFGPQRAMFASNFPVEKLTCPFPVLWNAFKLLAAGCSEHERRQLFCENARSLYRLELPSRG